MKWVWIVLSVTIYYAALVLSAVWFGVKGVALVVLACCCVGVVITLIDDRDSDRKCNPKHESCSGCKNNLGGGHCRINVEDECCEGGGFELYERGEG